ncbi:hypothetical protein Glove_269g22 [Diversispora epigaea]|uniref:Uncharacterized protein n=1 Tax=Diversispora epigaea TaxID=1348612 RepID=A0A397I8L5_9GLOM|nr:hypothetical protein Glove_269g22 [Diversispora epigaea]
MLTHKFISNYDNNTSAICSQIEKDENKIEAGKLYCCSIKDKSCTLYTSDSVCIGSDFEISKCYNTTAYDPCQRTDHDATKVCGGVPNSFFCMSSTSRTTKDTNYYRLPEAVKWIVNRSSVIDSKVISVCDNGIDFTSCNESSLPNGTIAQLTCGDLFQNAYNCSWTNWTDNALIARIERKPLGELCGALSVPTQTQTITPTPNNVLTYGLISSTVVLGIIAFTFAVSTFYYFRKYQKASTIRIAGDRP